MTPLGYQVLVEATPAPPATAPAAHELADALLEALARRQAPAVAPAAPQLTVADAVTRFEAWATATYRKRGKVTSEVGAFVRPAGLLREMFGALPAVAFDVQHLRQVRDRLIATKSRPRRVGEAADRVPCLTRATVNHHTARVLRIFRWLASECLVPGTVPQRLAQLQGLRRGRSAARETARVMPLAWDQVEPVLPHLHPEHRAIVELMWWTGARPSEICALRLVDVDRSGPVWVYHVPDERNKCAHRDQDRVVPLGPRAQAVLTAFLAQVPPARPDAYLFSPEGVAIRRYAKARATRKSKRWPSHSSARRRARRGSCVQSYRPCFDAGSLGKAIERACERAGVKPWGPNRIRHTVATRLASVVELRAAQVVLGHSSPATTERYAERDVTKACQVMAEHG